MRGNLVFNSVRETNDAGPFNQWCALSLALLLALLLAFGLRPCSWPLALALGFGP